VPDHQSERGNFILSITIHLKVFARTHTQKSKEGKDFKALTGDFIHTWARLVSELVGKIRRSGVQIVNQDLLTVLLLNANSLSFDTAVIKKSITNFCICHFTLLSSCHDTDFTNYTLVSRDFSFRITWLMCRWSLKDSCWITIYSVGYNHP
jgi:hypothetical protein